MHAPNDAPPLTTPDLAAAPPGPRHTVYFVSDGTGITAETIGHSVLTQFDSVVFDTYR
ncbi:MAG: kinase/pyrophosphorylase, partial [Pseudomonadota bacterium]|nr:kinase/pyrophosphorylase [Pseudomonadota bacterium]